MREDGKWRDLRGKKSFGKNQNGGQRDLGVPSTLKRGCFIHHKPTSGQGKRKVQTLGDSHALSRGQKNPQSKVWQG